MNLLFIISWGRDILIRPAGTFQEAKELKARLSARDPDLDFIFYSSGYFTPFNLDPWAPEISEQDIIELGGNPHHRQPYFDRQTIEIKKNKMIED